MLGCAQEQVNVGDEPINSRMVGYSEVILGPGGPGKRGAFDRSMQHHLRTDLFKGGVYDLREAVETFF
jgi:hypothetical protein